MGVKLIFLDIDGVLNTNYTNQEYTSTGACFVEDSKVAVLKELVDTTGAKIVLSSTWRIGWEHIEDGNTETSFALDFMELEDKFREFGLEFYDKTEILDRYMRLRGKEIKKYLDSRDDIDGYVIIDDLGGKCLRPCSSHLLQTSVWKGLERKHIKKAEKILNMSV